MLADDRPRPPKRSGRCAVARAVAGGGLQSSISVRHPATAASWSWANWAVRLGGSMRSW